MNRIAHFSDLHAELRPDEADKVACFIANDARTAGADLIVDGGDWYDGSTNPAQRNRSIALIRELAATAPIYGVAGNHGHPQDLIKFTQLDTAHPVRLALEAETVYFAGGRFEEFTGALDENGVFDRSGPDRIGALLICGLPWPRKAALVDRSEVEDGADLGALAMAKLEAIFDGFAAAITAHDGPAIVVAHADVPRAMRSKGDPEVGEDLVIPSGWFSRLVAAGASVCCLGHEHAAEEVAKGVHYSGAPRRTEFGEEEDKGYKLHDVARGQVATTEFRATPCARLVTVDYAYRDGSLNYQGSDGGDLTGAEVRLRYSFAETERPLAKAAVYEEAARLREDGALVTLDARPILAQRVSVGRAIAAATTNWAKVEAWFGAAQVDVAPERLPRLRLLVEQAEDAIGVSRSSAPSAVTVDSIRVRGIGRFKEEAFVDFRAIPGRVVGITGPNWAGKSTLSALIDAAMHLSSPDGWDPVDRAHGKRPFFEVGLTNGASWKLHQDLNPKSRATEGYVLDAAGALADSEMDRHLITPYKRWVGQHFPPAALYRSTGYLAQTGVGDPIEADSAALKQLCAEALGLEPLQRLAAHFGAMVSPKQGVGLKEQLATLRGELTPLRAAADKFLDAETAHRAAVDAASAAGADLSAIEREQAEHGEQRADLAARVREAAAVVGARRREVDAARKAVEETRRHVETAAKRSAAIRAVVDGARDVEMAIASLPNLETAATAARDDADRAASDLADADRFLSNARAAAERAGAERKIAGERLTAAERAHGDAIARLRAAESAAADLPAAEQAAIELPAFAAALETARADATTASQDLVESDAVLAAATSEERAQASAVDAAGSRRVMAKAALETAERRLGEAQRAAEALPAAERAAAQLSSLDDGRALLAEEQQAAARAIRESEQHDVACDRQLLAIRNRLETSHRRTADLSAQLERARAATADLPAAREAAGRLPDFERRHVAAQRVLSDLVAAIRNSEAHDGARERGLVTLQGKRANAGRVLADAREQGKLVDEVPCRGEGACGGCKLLERATSARQREAELAALLRDMDAEIGAVESQPEPAWYVPASERSVRQRDAENEIVAVLRERIPVAVLAARVPDLERLAADVDRLAASLDVERADGETAAADLAAAESAPVPAGYVPAGDRMAKQRGADEALAALDRERELVAKQAGRVGDLRRAAAQAAAAKTEVLEAERDVEGAAVAESAARDRQREMQGLVGQARAARTAAQQVAREAGDRAAAAERAIEVPRRRAARLEDLRAAAARAVEALGAVEQAASAVETARAAARGAESAWKGSDDRLAGAEMDRTGAADFLEETQAAVERARAAVEAARVVAGRAGDIERARGEHVEAEAAVAEAERALGEAQVELGRVERLEIEAGAAADDLARRAAELAAATPALRERCEAARAAATTADRALAVAARDLETARTAMVEADEKEEEIAEAEERLLDVTLLARALGKDGVQAMEIDAAAPAVSEIATELLSECFGDLYALRLVTQVPKVSSQSGETKEEMQLQAFDTSMEEPRWIRAREVLSGGGKVIGGLAARFALSIYMALRSGREVNGDLVMDEPDKGLRGANIGHFMRMLRRALKRGGFNRAIMIPLTPEALAGCDSTITVADGRVEVG